MTDRELLELAAKAAGLTILGWPQEDYATVQDGDHQVGWCPLKFNSDALRLAVKLHITVDRSEVKRAAFCYCDFQDIEVSALEPHGDDPYAATRRAIVRAAAEIGRSMEC